MASTSRYASFFQNTSCCAGLAQDLCFLHSWTYAGWVTSKKNSIPPKTLRGNWEPIVSTEELERGLAILAKRTVARVQRRRHQYLLRGMIYYEDTHLQDIYDEVRGYEEGHGQESKTTTPQDGRFAFVW